MPEQEAALDTVQESLLALLRTKGLSIRDLDAAKKEQLREFLDYLHNTKGISLTDVSKLIGNKTSGYASWLCKQLGVTSRPFEEARLKGIREKRRKYERRPFDGTDEERAYLLGLRHGDLSASRPWDGAVRVSTSTTHPAMAHLFRSLFEPYGHVYQHPRYKKDTKTYEWNLSTVVDNSFEFLLEDRSRSLEWVALNESTVLAYIAGVLDAEGSIGIYSNGKGTSLQALFYNTRLELLEYVKSSLMKIGYDPVGPYLDKEKGTSTAKYGIIRRKDYWKLALARFAQVQHLLRLLPIRHAEKIARRDVALSFDLGQPWVDIAPRVAGLRNSIRAERDAFVLQAEVEYKKKHTGQ